MTPEQKLKHKILLLCAVWSDKPIEVEVTKENIDALYDECDDDARHDAQNEVRGGEVETGLECPMSRHYESKAVASRMPDGSWVGWTYWYGGGKHGEPEAVDWMDQAYDLDMKEEEKTVIVKTFTKKAVTA